MVICALARENLAGGSGFGVILYFLNYAQLRGSDGRAASLSPALALLLLLPLRCSRSAWHREGISSRFALRARRLTLDGRRAAARRAAEPRRSTSHDSCCGARWTAAHTPCSARRRRQRAPSSCRRPSRRRGARAAAAADAARGARRVHGRTQRPLRRPRSLSRLHGRRRARDDGRADATPFAQPRTRPRDAVARLVDQCGLCCCCASLTAPRRTRRAHCVRRSQRRDGRHICAAIAVLDVATPRPGARTILCALENTLCVVVCHGGFSCGGLSPRCSRSVTNPALGFL